MAAIKVKVAIITGASRGLGLALGRALAARGWALALDARGEEALRAAAAELGAQTVTLAVPGDVTDEPHRKDLVAAAEGLGEVCLLVNNAAVLGASPPPELAGFALDAWEAMYRINVFAPLRLFQIVAPALERSGGRVVNLTSEAAVEPFVGWGGYGSTKAAVEQMSAVMALEHPRLRIYWVDPGDMNTQMEQDGFPSEDVSDRPPPEASVPGFLRLIEGDLPSGRYRAQAM